MCLENGFKKKFIENYNGPETTEGTMEHKKVHVIAMCWMQDEISVLENWPGGGRIVFLMIVYRPTPDHTAAFVGKVSIKVHKTLNL